MLKILFVELFFNPRKFFTERISFCKKHYIWLTYLIGIYSCTERFEHVCVKAEVVGGKQLEFLSSMSWSLYWILTLIFGALGGVIVWWVSGWWYKVRIKWSGAKRPDPFESRLIYISSSFVYAAPIIATYLSATFFFKNPWGFHSADSGNFYIEITAILAYMLLYFWSVFVSYIGVTTRFSLVKWKARLWFMILPVVLQIVGIISVATIYYYLYGQQ
jgi:hypothetical protein